MQKCEPEPFTVRFCFHRKKDGRVFLKRDRLLPKHHRLFLKGGDVWVISFRWLYMQENV
jgi:hypothetical protein